MGFEGLALKHSISNITNKYSYAYVPEHIVVKVVELLSSPKEVIATREVFNGCLI